MTLLFSIFTLQYFRKNLACISEEVIVVAVTISVIAAIVTEARAFFSRSLLTSTISQDSVFIVITSGIVNEPILFKNRTKSENCRQQAV